MSLTTQKETLELLSNPTRLRIIHALQAHEGRLEVSQLAEMLAEYTHSQEDANRVKRRLTQSILRIHLPKMEQLGLVKYEALDNTISLRELPTPIASELESMLLLLFDLLRIHKKS